MLHRFQHTKSCSLAPCQKTLISRYRWDLNIEFHYWMMFTSSLTCYFMVAWLHYIKMVISVNIYTIKGHVSGTLNSSISIKDNATMLQPHGKHGKNNLICWLSQIFWTTGNVLSTSQVTSLNVRLSLKSSRNNEAANNKQIMNQKVQTGSNVD